MLVAGEGLGLRVEAVEPTSIGADPQYACTVLKYGVDSVAAQAVGVVRIVLIATPLFRGWIKTAQSTTR